MMPPLSPKSDSLSTTDFMEKEAPSEATVETQKSLSVILDEIEHRANNAIEGPWFTANDNLEAGPHTSSGLALIETGRNEDWWPARLCEWPTAEFIAAARNDVPRLVKALRRALDYCPEHLDVQFEREIAQLLSESPPPGKPESRKALEEPGATNTFSTNQ